MVYLLKSLFYLLIQGSLKIQNDFCPNCDSNSIRKTVAQSQKDLIDNTNYRALARQIENYFLLKKKLAAFVDSDS